MKTNLSSNKICQVSLYLIIAVGMLLLYTGCTALPTVFSAHTSTPPALPAAAATSTVIPGPSQTPVGVYTNQKLGFSLTYPAGWSVSKQTSSQVLITDSHDHISLIVQPVSNHLSLKQCMSSAPKLFSDTALGKLNSSKVGANQALALADGTNALRESISTKFSKGGSLTMQVVCAQSKTHMYAFFIFGTATNMKAQTDMVDGIYKSIHLE